MQLHTRQGRIEGSLPKEVELYSEGSEGLWAKEGQNLICAWGMGWGFPKAVPGSGDVGPVCNSSEGLE